MELAPYKDRKYSVVTYDESWPAQFEAEAKKLKGVFGDRTLGIEHIGSTSVPGMDGKPVIDILVLAGSIADADDLKGEMEKSGYAYAGQFVADNSRLYRRMDGNVLLANIHVFPFDHPHVKEMLGLRDYLRSHPDEVKEYSQVKKELFEKYSGDYAEYRKQKDVYMGELKKRVLRSAQ